MHIVMSFNSKFILPALVSVYSLMKHNDDVKLHVLYSDLTNAEILLVKQLADADRKQEIQFYYIENKVIEKLHLYGTYTPEIYYRFMVYQILDNSVERALYLDSDTLIRGDIRPLYEAPMGDNFFLGCIDNTCDSEYKERIKNYVNSGVLLMNLNKLRASDDMDKYWDFVTSPDYDAKLPDQDALNFIFEGRIGFVQTNIWNCFPFWETTDEKFLFTVMYQSRIVHFISKIKPWKEECVETWIEAALQYPASIHLYKVYNEYLNEAVACIEQESAK